jgi:hypothetical protein
MRYTLIIAVSVSILLSGCSEKPERQAAREVKKSTDSARKTVSKGRNTARRNIRLSDKITSEAIKKALEEGGSRDDVARAIATSQEEFNKAQKLISDSFEQARVEIENSLRKNPRSGKTKTPALLTSGNILFSQALHLQSALPDSSSPIDFHIDDISNNALLMGDLLTIKAMREKLIAANDKEIQQFKDAINKGTDDYPGLKSKLRSEESKLNKIDSQMQTLEANAKKARDTANSIEKSALEKLRAAEALSGDEKLALQNEAFDLRLSKKEYSMNLQAASDEMALLKSRMAIIAPIVEKIIRDITSIEDKIKSINDTRGNAKLLADIKAIDSKYDKHTESIRKNIRGITVALNKYLASVKEVSDLLDMALGQYEKVGRGIGIQTAKNRKATCYLWKAGLYAESMRTQKNLILRAKSITVSSDATIAALLDTIVTESSAKAADYANTALTIYDLAIAEYKDISGNNDFGCTARKSHILALYGKMALAEYMGNTAISEAVSDENYLVADDAATKAEELIEQIKDCDPKFGMSITARMLGGEIDYTPNLQIDQAAHYEDLRKGFQAWNTFKGVEKEDEVNRLILVLENMKPAEDPEAFDRILEPELAQLKAAKKKGFDEDDEDTYDEDTDSTF